MKKALITVLPICVVLFVSTWILWGLEGALAFFGATLLVIVLAGGFIKWIDFVDEHIKD